MALDDKQKHQQLRDALKQNKSIGTLTDAVEHLLDHIERLDKRVEQLEQKTRGISAEGGKTFLG